MHDRAEQGEDATAPGLIALDANALDQGSAGRGDLVARFLTLLAAGEVTILVSPGVRAELAHPHTPAALAAALLAPAPPPAPSLRHAQKLDRIRVRAILRGDGPPERHEADALNLAEAAEAGCAVFITHDRRILRRRTDLRAVLPALRIMTLEAFMATLTPHAADEDGRSAF